MSDLAIGDCGVCIGTDECESNDFFSSNMFKARKLHKCCECRLPISVGQYYERSVMKAEGEMFTFKTCANCKEIRDAMTCGNGYYFEQLWEEMRDYVFPDMTTGCLGRLQSAAAKQFLIERWQKWKGLR